MRLRTFTLAALAIALGAWLRFAGLAARELSADEGPSWAAAVAPSAADVLRLQARLNPGKLGVHDLALHYWIRAFNDSAPSMRALSAAAGTLAIVIVFLLTRELMAASVLPADSGQNVPPTAPSPPDHDAVAAIAALLFAVNLVTIKYSREARMYPLALLFTLTQVWLLLRAARRGGLANYSGTALFTVLSVATNLTSILTLAPEGIWLLLILLARGERGRAPVFKLAAALAAGLVLTLPLAIVYLRMRTGPMRPEAIGWIPLPPLYAPLALFNKATGSFAFPVLAALAGWGVWRGSSRAHGAVLFALLWMFAPPILVLAFSYSVHPAFIERYMISCFVPFFALVAIGIWELGLQWARLAALAVAVALALGHVASYERKPHDLQWREAAIIATCYVTTDGAVAVAPGYATSVVRYYLRRSPAVNAVPIDEPAGAGVAIVAEQGVAPARSAELVRTYPRILARLRGVAVRATLPALSYVSRETCRVKSFTRGERASEAALRSGG